MPKKYIPTELSECRNISCTAFFSKVFEFFLLKRIKNEMAPTQYGGMGSGTMYFLADAWENILEGIKDNRAAVNIISVDFEKAFNRMGHAACLEALAQHSAS